MTRTKITDDATGNVTIVYENAFGDIITRDFTCPYDGGYIREYVGSDLKQVCAHLSNMGQTLTADSRADLVNVIRAEYRAMRRAEKRAFERDY